MIFTYQILQIVAHVSIFKHIDGYLEPLSHNRCLVTIRVLIYLWPQMGGITATVNIRRMFKNAFKITFKLAYYILEKIISLYEILSLTTRGGSKNNVFKRHTKIVHKRATSICAGQNACVKEIYAQSQQLSQGCARHTNEGIDRFLLCDVVFRNLNWCTNLQLQQGWLQFY